MTAKEAIDLSVRVGEKLRQIAGKGDVVELRNRIPQLFADEAERTEANRLLDLAVWVRRKRVQEVMEADMFAEVGTWQD